MFGPVFDDYFHVLNACQVAERMPEYRFLVYWINCIGGESLIFTRLISLFFLILFMLFVARLFRPAKTGIIKFDQWLPLALLLHPVILFPFFYASQMSTSLMLAWAAGTALFLARYPGSKPREIFAISLGLILIGNYLRVESLIVAYVILGSFILHHYVMEEKPIRDFLAPLSLKRWLGVLSFSAGFLLINKLSQLMVGTEHLAAHLDAFDVNSSGEGFYPHGSFYAVQVWAILLYFRNYLFPFDASFFGPWLNWWTIHQDRGYQLWLYFGYLLSLITLTAAVFSRVLNRSLRLICSGLLVFILCCSLFSFYPRKDWYFISRQVLASGLLSLFIFSAISSSRAAARPVLLKRLLSGFFGWMIVSLGFIYWNQFRDNQRFLEFEFNHNSGTAPQVWFQAANYRKEKGDLSKALAHLHRAYALIPPDSIQVSEAAKTYWVESLFWGYRLSKQAGDDKSFHTALDQLLRSESYLATLACLEEPSIDLARCKEGRRKENFCADMGNVTYRVFPDPAKVRIPIGTYCKKG